MKGEKMVDLVEKYDLLVKNTDSQGKIKIDDDIKKEALLERKKILEECCKDVLTYYSTIGGVIVNKDVNLYHSTEINKFLKREDIKGYIQEIRRINEKLEKL